MQEQEKTNFDKYLSELEIQLPRLNITLKGFENIIQFVSNEVAFWSNINNNSVRSQRIRQSIKNINSCNRNLKSISECRNSPQGLSEVTQISNSLFSETRNLLLRNDILFSDFSEVKLFKIMAEENKFTEIDGASWYFYNEATFNNGPFSPDMLKGFLRAYEYDLKGKTDISLRAQEELKSLETIRAKWNLIIDKAENDFQVQKASIDDKILQLQQLQIDIQNKDTETFTKIESKIKDWENNLDLKYNQFEKDKNLLIDNVILDKNKEFSKLENTYNDKLQLEAPVKYWNQRIKKYKGNGWWWFCAFSGLIIAILVYFVFFLNQINATSLIVNGKFNPGSIQHILTFLTVVSFGAYLIKVFSKLTFSNFHLQRDSEERLQLTMVYLALLKDGTHQASPDDKKIILQAIFGRVETGLLGMDGSPTIPGINTVVEKFAAKG